jgi:hypothetical protein
MSTWTTQKQLIPVRTYFFVWTSQVLCNGSTGTCITQDCKACALFIGALCHLLQWVLKYSNKVTSFIPNLLFLLKNITHSASSPFSSSTSISSRSSTIVPRLRFCPDPPHRHRCCCWRRRNHHCHCCYRAITVSVALPLTVDFNLATATVVNIKRNWGAVVILLSLLASRWQPSGQPSGQLAPAANAIAATANGHIIRASCWCHDGLNEIFAIFWSLFAPTTGYCDGIIVPYTEFLAMNRSDQPNFPPQRFLTKSVLTARKSRQEAREWWVGLKMDLKPNWADFLSVNTFPPKQSSFLLVLSVLHPRVLDKILLSTVSSWGDSLCCAKTAGFSIEM